VIQDPRLVWRKTRRNGRLKIVGGTGIELEEAIIAKHRCGAILQSPSRVTVPVPFRLIPLNSTESRPPWQPGGNASSSGEGAPGSDDVVLEVRNFREALRVSCEDGMVVRQRGRGDD